MKKIIFFSLFLLLAALPLSPVLAKIYEGLSYDEGYTPAPNYCRAGIDQRCERIIYYNEAGGEKRSSTCEMEPSGVYIYNCVCQGSNQVDDCHVGGLMSDPICVCCGDCTLYNTLELGTNVAQMILKYLGLAAFVMFIVGGIVWMTAGGIASRVDLGRKIIVGAVVGIMIVLGAYLIVQTVLKWLAPGYEMPETEETSYLPDNQLTKNMVILFTGANQENS